MTGLFSDMRRTAASAGVLLLLALLFAEPGGVGGSTVTRDQGQGEASAHITPPPSPGWFGGADAEPTPEPAAPSAPGPAPRAEPAAGVIVPPGPVGPDFPPGLTAPRYSSSAAGP